MGKDGTVYYGRGADGQVKIASITKVMTAILTVENCKMDEKVTVSKDVYKRQIQQRGDIVGKHLTRREIVVAHLTAIVGLGENVHARRRGIGVVHRNEGHDAHGDRADHRKGDDQLKVLLQQLEQFEKEMCIRDRYWVLRVAIYYEDELTYSCTVS